jgi:hypothetical protein
LLEVKAQGASGDVDEPDYAIRISRVRDGGMVTVDASEETMLSPGDVVEVKLKRRVSQGIPGEGSPGLPNEAVRDDLDPTSSIAEGIQPATK